MAPPNPLPHHYPPATMDPDGGAPPIAAPLLLLRRRRLPSLSSSFRLKTTLLSEIGGAVGDLGTFIPIALALALVNGLDLGTTLIFTAIYNALTGALFGIPMPVQPMKSIAAAAVSSHPPLSLPQISAAGIATAAALLLLGLSGLMSLFYRLIPLPVVRGVQLSQGLAFAFSAVNYIRYEQNFSSSAAASSGDPRPWLGLDGLILALSALIFIVIATGTGDDRRRPTKIPAALLVFILGIVLCFIRRDNSVAGEVRLGPSPIGIVKISWEDWKVGIIEGAVPQLPLSVLNSVLAVCKLSGDLFPDQAVAPAAVSVSVGAMNLVGCWFGAMPVCHGAGGLAGQYRFGGRSGLAVLFLAGAKMAIGLAFGGSFVRILGKFPVGLLGVLLLFAGVELAMAARDMASKEDAFVTVVCAAVSLTGSSAALGFGCGVVMVVLLRLREVEVGSLVRGFRSFRRRREQGFGFRLSWCAEVEGGVAAA